MPFRAEKSGDFKKNMAITCVFCDCVIYLHYRNYRDYRNDIKNNHFYFKTKQQECNVLYLF
jgi:hypothetical protein